MMIRQPEQVDEGLLEQVVGTATSSKKLLAAGRLRLERFGEGLAAQVLHLGPYATEGPTIQRRHAFSPSRGTAGLAGTTSAT